MRSCSRVARAHTATRQVCDCAGFVTAPLTRRLSGVPPLRSAAAVFAGTGSGYKYQMLLVVCVVMCDNKQKVYSRRRQPASSGTHRSQNAMFQQKNTALAGGGGDLPPHILHHTRAQRAARAHEGPISTRSTSRRRQPASSRSSSCYHDTKFLIKNRGAHLSLPLSRLDNPVPAAGMQREVCLSTNVVRDEAL